MIPLIVIALVAVAGTFLLRDTLTFEALATHRESLAGIRDANYLVAALAFIAVYVVIIAFSLPGGAVATVTGGFLFSTVPGAALSIIGATIGATIIFLAVRMGLGDRIAARLDGSDGMVKRIKAGIDGNQWSFLFLMRLVPAVPFFVANVVPALVGVPLNRYVVSTFFGIMPGGLVFASLGAGLDAIIARGEAPDPGIIFEPEILLPILGLCLLALLPVILKALGRKTV